MDIALFLQRLYRPDAKIIFGAVWGEHYVCKLHGGLHVSVQECMDFSDQEQAKVEPMMPLQQFFKNSCQFFKKYGTIMVLKELFTQEHRAAYWFGLCR